MRKRTLLALAIPLIGLVFHSHPSIAQPPTKGELLQDIQDVETLDPEIERYFPRWKIQEADLKIKLTQFFRSDGHDVAETDSFVVTASFPRGGSQDILMIRAGSGDAYLSGTDKIKLALGIPIYNEILARNYANQQIEPAIPPTQGGRERVPSVMNPVNARQFIAISAFRQAVQLGTTGARIEHQIGTDEIGYHFWSSGQGRVFVNYPIIRLDDAGMRAQGVPDVLTVNLGAAYRLKFGSKDDEFLGGAINARLLNGALGTKGLTRIEFRPQLDGVNLGVALNAEVPFGKFDTAHAAIDGLRMLQEMTIIPKPGPFPRSDTIITTNAYFLRSIVQGSVFWETWLDDYAHFFRVSLGMSYQEFGRYQVTDTVNFGQDVGLRPVSLIHPSEVQDWVYAKVEYLNQSGFPFGISAQLSNQNLIVDGFIPVVPNWLFLEAKFSTPILRDKPQPWEQKSFFMISPILRFKMDL